MLSKGILSSVSTAEKEAAEYKYENQHYFKIKCEPNSTMALWAKKYLEACAAKHNHAIDVHDELNGKTGGPILTICAFGNINFVLNANASELKRAIAKYLQLNDEELKKRNISHDLLKESIATLEAIEKTHLQPEEILKEKLKFEKLDRAQREAVVEAELKLSGAELANFKTVLNQAREDARVKLQTLQNSNIETLANFPLSDFLLKEKTKLNATKTEHFKKRIDSILAAHQVPANLSMKQLVLCGATKDTIAFKFDDTVLKKVQTEIIASVDKWYGVKAANDFSTLVTLGSMKGKEIFYPFVKEVEAKIKYLTDNCLEINSKGLMLIQQNGSDLHAKQTTLTSFETSKPFDQKHFLVKGGLLITAGLFAYGAISSISGSTALAASLRKN